ncbi:MAG: hypothetical protein IT178_06835 [Acidobacteria bacterium]|nr:hypothetical protein [Acidobacteriota bacterium]
MSIELMIMASAVATVALVQLFVSVRLSRAVVRVDEVQQRVDERLQQLSGAMELLTDTAETGFSQMATALERPARRPASRTSRQAVVRRITSAVKQGQSFADIAAREGLSEGEVRLHLQMTPPPAASSRAAAAAR